MKCLEKDRTRRYGSASDLAADIRRHLDSQPVLASPPSTVYRAKKFVRRHRFGVAAAATLVVLLVAFGATMAVQAQRIAQERDRANREAETAKQVSDFLVGLFSVSDPSEAKGRSVTAREILSAGASQIDQSLRDQPEIQARLQMTIGSVFGGLGLYADAEPLLRRAAETNRRLLGDDNATTLQAVTGLATQLWYLGRYRDAEVLYSEVADRRTRTLGERHQDTLKSRAHLASTYLMQGRIEEAERLLLKVADLQRQVLGEDAQATLLTVNTLQGVYYRALRYADALPLAKKVLDGRRRLLGGEHPETITAMHNLATIYDQLGRDAEAEPLFLEVIQKRQRVQGDQHPSTCNSRERLAVMYMDQRRFAEAEPLFLAAYQGFFQSYGGSHERTQRSASRLVALYDGWGKADKAAEWRAKLPKPAAPAPVR